ncbi:cytochrome C [Methylocella silvestris]|uniref:Cytochrome C n=1 Tax=Methylocella silvestris TaxID=199596 RepID=A0A2J7TLA6_METSI|nr:cytochrome C [Methylocella silvestris]
MIVLAVLGSLHAAATARAEDVDPGRRQFAASCGVCHSVDPGASARQGPNLRDVYGRKAGSAAGFAYSQALKGGDWIWDEATLDTWIANAQEAHPGTFMTYRQADPQKRKLVINYLKSLSASK